MAKAASAVRPMPDILSWIADRFTGQPTSSTCDS